MRVAVRYERVNFFCYKCGMLGHDFKSCKAEVCKDKDGKRIYGQWVSAVPERDNEFALAKYAKGWAEEDCREWRSACEEDRAEARGSPQAREEEGDEIKSDDCQSDVTRMMVVGTVGDIPRRETQAKDGSPAVETLEVAGKLGPASVELCEFSGPDQTAKAQQLLVRPNPAPQGLTTRKHLNRSPKLSNSTADPTPRPGRTPQGKEHGPRVQVSPISDMANRMGEVTLKRNATEPDSPKPAKKRCLFTGEVGVEGGEAGMSVSARKKSVKEVKRTMRGKARKKGGELQPVNLAAEIDFPKEWLASGSQRDKGDVASQEADRLSGCPTTATGVE